MKILFKRILCAVLAFSLSLAGGAFVFAEESDLKWELLAQYDFSDGLLGFKTSSNKVKVEKSETEAYLKLSATDGEESAVLEGSWSDYCFKADFKMLSGGYGGIILRQKDENTCLLLKFYPSSKKLMLLQKVAGSRFTKLAEGSVEGVIGKELKIEAVALGKTVSVSVDGEQVLYSDKVSIEKGSAGFFAQNAMCCADNVSILLASKQGETNWELLGMVKDGDDMGIPESYGALEGKTIYEQYKAARAEIPEEFPIVAPSEVKGGVEIFVSPSGDDNNSGTKEAPVKTLEKGLELLKSCDKSKGAVLWLRKGSYPVKETLVIDFGYSGTEEYPVFISGYEDEEAVISDAVQVGSENWEELSDSELARVPSNARRYVRKIDLKKQGIKVTDDLTVSPTKALSMKGEGVEFIPARYPNNTTVGMGKVIDRGTDYIDIKNGIPERGFQVELVDDRPFSWKTTDDMWSYGAFYKEWELKHWHIKEFDKSTNSLTSITACHYGAEYEADNFHYYYNIMEELDCAGEYVIDRTNQILYFYPLENKEDSAVKISVKGETEILLKLENAENVVINNISMKDGIIPGIKIEYCTNCKVQKCFFENMGRAVQLYDGKNNGLIHSVISNCGDDYTAVSLGSTNESRYALVPSGNYVQNNCIFNDASSGTLLANNVGCGTVIGHNLLCGSGGSGITEGWSNEFIVEFNEIANTALTIYDAGAVYECGYRNDGGMHVRNNYIHDLCPYGDGRTTNATYADDFSGERFFYNNICQDGNMYAHGGQHNVFENNITTGALIINANYMHVWEDLWQNNFLGLGDNMAFLRYNLFLSNRTKWDSRYKTLAAWTKQFEEYKELAEAPGYERGALEDDIRSPKGNVAINNIVGTASLAELAKESLVGYDTNKFMPFSQAGVSFENHKIKDENGYLSEDTGYQLPDIEKMGSVEIEGVFEKPQMPAPKCHFPSNGVSGQISYSDVELKWTPSMGAYYYTVDISDTADMSNILESQTVSKCYAKPGCITDYGKTYYWRVTAHSVARFIKNTEAESEVFSFTTMTEEETIKYVPVQTKAFEMTVAELQALADSAKEGNGKGEYAFGAVDEANAAVKDAKNIVKKSKLQSEVEDAKKAVNNAILKLKSKQNLFDFNFGVDAAQGKLNKDAFCDGRITSQGLVLDPSDGEKIVASEEKLPLNTSVKFDMKIDDFSDWTYFALRAQEPKGSFNTSYMVVLKPDILEIQKYKGGHNYGIVKTAENNSEIVKNGVVHNYEFIVKNIESGVSVELKIDGKSVMEYIDSENLVGENGYFALRASDKNGLVTIK